MAQCPIHNQEMKHYSNDKGDWDSHKLADGTWCNGKEKKPYQANQALQSTALAQIQASQARIEARLDKMAEFLKLQNWPGGTVEPTVKVPTKTEDLPF